MGPLGAGAAVARRRRAGNRRAHTRAAGRGPGHRPLHRPPTGPAPRSERLAAAVVALPPRVRAALVLRLFDELSEGDTALALRCPVPAVSGLVSEGLSRLEVAVAPERRGEEHRQ